MVTTQGTALKAYIAIEELNKQTFSGPIAKKLFNLYKTLKPVYEFQLQEEKKIFSKYPEFDPTINGCPVKDNNPETIERARTVAKSVDSELKDLGAIEIDIDCEPIIIPESEQTNLKISGAFIGYLEGFVDLE